MNKTFLESPRWPGGAPICSVVNLLAFETEKAAKGFQTSLPGSDLFRLWECRHCGGFHYLAYRHGPSGNSSGYDRRHDGGMERLEQTYARLIAL